MINKISLGGGCFWCTEAVFQSLKGVKEVTQVWVSSDIPNESFSEAVIVEFDPEVIDLIDLIEIHLHTHNSESDHSFRNKYRSAVYYFEESDYNLIRSHLDELAFQFENDLITKVLPVRDYKVNDQNFQDYYLSNPEKPFCQRYIKPKLELLKEKHEDLLTADDAG